MECMCAAQLSCSICILDALFGNMADDDLSTLAIVASACRLMSCR